MRRTKHDNEQQQKNVAESEIKKSFWKHTHAASTKHAPKHKFYKFLENNAVISSISPSYLLWVLCVHLVLLIAFHVFTSP